MNIFVFNYLDNAPEGYLPKEFEEVSEAPERMLLLNESNEISMVLPENASKLLILATQTFSDSFAEQYGICIKTSSAARMARSSWDSRRRKAHFKMPKTFLKRCIWCRE